MKIILAMGVLIVLFARCESEVLYYDPSINGKYNLEGTQRYVNFICPLSPSLCIDTTYEENMTLEVKRIAKHKIEIYGMFPSSTGDPARGYPNPVVATLNENSFEFSFGSPSIGGGVSGSGSIRRGKMTLRYEYRSRGYYTIHELSGR